jgi:tetratricopeptide (TPR) repeat protein
MKTIDYSYFIERYNACEMDEKEKTWFESELEDNIMLQKELELRKRTDAVLQNQDIINLRNKLAAIEKSREKSKNLPVSAKKGGAALKYAAIMTGIILLGGFLLTSLLKQGPDNDFSNYFTAFEPISDYRSESDKLITDSYNKGVYYYNELDFETAIKCFTQSIEEDPDNSESAFYRGKANFNLQNYKEAKPDFEFVKNTVWSLYRENAQWLLIGCYLNTNETDKAIQGLTEIASSDSKYMKSAKKLLRQLERSSGN